MKKNAFTLIELLAVILILGIIALIAVPIVTNIISDAKENAAKRSAESFIKATDNEILVSKTENNIPVNRYYSNNQEEDSENILYDGTYTTDQLIEKGVKVKGTIPNSGNVTIKKGQVVDCQLEINNYTIACNGKSENGYEAKLNKVYDVSYKDFRCNVKGIGKVDPVYFNPVTGNSCTEEEYENGKNLMTEDIYNPYYNPETIKTGNCMQWYPYHYNNDGTVDMIMGNNLYLENDSYDLNYYYDEDGNRCDYSNMSDGLNKVINVLNIETSNWVGVPLRTDSYTYPGNDMHYNISYNGMRARLISAEEIAAITGRKSFSVIAYNTGVEGSGGMGYSETFFLDSCFDTFYRTFWYTDSEYEFSDLDAYLKNISSKYEWLYKNGSYMTISMIEDPNLENKYDIRNWGVYSQGVALIEGSWNGIRPVITIPKEKISSYINRNK